MADNDNDPKPEGAVTAGDLSVQMTQMVNYLRQLCGDEIDFVFFVNHRGLKGPDGSPMSYVSNLEREQAQCVLRGWLALEQQANESARKLLMEYLDESGEIADQLAPVVFADAAKRQAHSMAVLFALDSVRAYIMADVLENATEQGRDAAAILQLYLEASDILMRTGGPIGPRAAKRRLESH